MPLDHREVHCVAKSVARWVWRKFSASQFSALQAHRGVLSGERRRERERSGCRRSRVCAPWWGARCPRSLARSGCPSGRCTGTFPDWRSVQRTISGNSLGSGEWGPRTTVSGANSDRRFRVDDMRACLGLMWGCDGGVRWVARWASAGGDPFATATAELSPRVGCDLILVLAFARSSEPVLTGAVGAARGGGRELSSGGGRLWVWSGTVRRRVPCWSRGCLSDGIPGRFRSALRSRARVRAQVRIRLGER